jgi:hypothetical protein
MTDILQEAVSLSNGRRMRGGILAYAYPLPENWEHGIAFLGGGCVEPQITGPCAVTDRVESRPGDASIFEPVFITQTAACSMLSKVGVVDLAANRLEATTEWALGVALATGAQSTNPALTDAENVTNADDVVDAVSCLEFAAGNYGYGAEIFLHAPLRAAAYLRSNHLIEDGFSPSGFRWVLNPGYPADDELVTIWATGTLFAGVTDAETLINPATGMPPVGWQMNTSAAFRQRLGLAAFDPCLNLSATFTVPLCTGGS